VDERLQILLSLSAELATEHDIRAVLLKLTNATRKLLNADRCSVFLHDQQRAQLWTIVADGVEEIRIPDDKGIAGQVLRSGRELNVTDVYENPHFDQSTDAATGYRTRRMLALPLADMEGHCLGVFQAINKLDGERFSSDDANLLRHVAMYAGSAIESAQLYERLRKAHEDVIYKLSHATKFKDPETQNHIIRVGLYCDVLAREMGLTPPDRESIRLAAPMHDIGKVGVPDRILQKPGALLEEEWAVMKEHTSYGYDILKGGDSHLLEVAALVALEHHEKWAGGGYPRDKRGDDISLHGRMTAVADVFDALTSKRHYKAAWDNERVIALFKEERGRHFDPALVDILLTHTDEFYAIKRTCRDE